MKESFLFVHVAAGGGGSDYDATHVVITLPPSGSCYL